MKYIIMCGGEYPKFKIPKQLLKVNGEVIVERTIRLLRENGITDIAVSTNNPKFDYLDVELLHNKKDKFVTLSPNEVKASCYSWLNAYYPIDEPVCYLHGDVYFSDEAIKQIVETKVKDTMFICVPDKQDIPNKDYRNRKGREPLGYKVENYKLFRNAIDDLLNMIDEGKFINAKQSPIAWTVYRYLNGLDIGLNAKDYGDLNDIFKSNGDYMIINDYTTDIDSEKDIKVIEDFINKGGKNMIKVEAIKDFTLARFGEIKDTLVRNKVAVEGKIFKGDTFECTQELAEYLSGKNSIGQTVIKVIEVIPEKENKEEPKIIETIETSVGTFGYGPVEVKATKPKTPKKKKSKKRVDF